MSSAPLAPGYRIGEYELVHVLGRGAVGETFKARVVTGPRHGQLVCLKVLAQEFRGVRSAERDAAVRFLQHEARVVSQLDHPNIARLLDSGVSDDVSYLAFELVEGANLSDVLAHAPLDADNVMHIGLELSKALACAHERDVLHRDIKPNNILISTDGEVKLVDFGLAKLNAAAASKFSQHVGTPRYFSPEQIRGEALTPTADIYSVGLVLFELLTGAHPFHNADIDVFAATSSRAFRRRLCATRASRRISSRSSSAAFNSTARLVSSTEPRFTTRCAQPSVAARGQAPAICANSARFGRTTPVPTARP